MSCGGCGTIVNLAQGVAGNVKAMVGIERPPDDVVRARRRLCLKCEHAIPCLDAGIIIIGRKCKCGACEGPIKCPIKSKTAVASQECPAGKWPAVKPASGE